MKQTTLKSGAVLNMQLASLEDGLALLDEILLELVGVRMGEGVDLNELFGKDLMGLKDAVFKVMASKKVKAAVWVCMGSCTYQPPGEKAALRITNGPSGTFQSEQTRGDFFPVAGEVAVFNLAPFFANLTLPSFLQSKLGTASNVPGSETT